MSIHSNPEVENIVNQATKMARDYKHQYVTLEHLLIALIEDPKFTKLLQDFEVQIDDLLRDLYDYIGRQDYLVYTANPSINGGKRWGRC